MENSSVESGDASSCSLTHCLRAPRWFPRCGTPVGWMPENTTCFFFPRSGFNGDWVEAFRTQLAHGRYGKGAARRSVWRKDIYIFAHVRVLSAVKKLPSKRHAMHGRLLSVLRHPRGAAPHMGGLIDCSQTAYLTTYLVTFLGFARAWIRERVAAPKQHATFPFPFPNWIPVEQHHVVDR